MSISFLEALARPQPDPGGGAAAAYGASLGLALLAKVMQLELQRPRADSRHTSLWQEGLDQVRRLTADLEGLREEDVRAYLNLAQARAAAAQGAALLAAIHEALKVPRQIIERALEGLTLVSCAGKYCQKHLVSDLLVAGELLGAALQGAYHIASANLHLVEEELHREEFSQELRQFSRQGHESFLQMKAELHAKREIKR